MATAAKTVSPAKAVPCLGPYPSKIGKEELLEVLDLWEFTPETRRQIAELVRNRSAVPGAALVPLLQSAAQQSRGGGKGDGRSDRRKALPGGEFLHVGAGMRVPGVEMGAGDEVIVPAYTFLATAATVVASNAIPVIVEVDDTLCLDPAAVEKAISKRTKAIAPVHMRRGAGSDGRHSGHRPPQRPSGRRRRGPGGRRFVPRQAIGKPGDRRLLQL